MIHTLVWLAQSLDQNCNASVSGNTSIVAPCCIEIAFAFILSGLNVTGEKDEKWLQRSVRIRKSCLFCAMVTLLSSKAMKSVNCIHGFNKILCAYVWL